MEIYPPLALKLHGFGLERLFDPNWTGLELYDLAKRHYRGRAEPRWLFQRTIRNGFLYLLGQWLFEEYVCSEDWLRGLSGEYVAWHLEDYCGFLLATGVAPEDIRSEQSQVESFFGLFESDEDAYYEHSSSRKFTAGLVGSRKKLRISHERAIGEAKRPYALDYAERVFHDRSLCGYLSELIVAIGFDGTVEDEEPSQWCERRDVPQWAKRAVVSRDRGKCAICSADVVLELEDDPHVDHIVALARGGCNDLVNLQLLCMPCNLAKRAKTLPVRTSVPNYLGRRSR